MLLRACLPVCLLCHMLDLSLALRSLKSHIIFPLETSPAAILLLPPPPLPLSLPPTEADACGVCQSKSAATAFSQQTPSRASRPISAPRGCRSCLLPASTINAVSAMLQSQKHHIITVITTRYRHTTWIILRAHVGRGLVGMGEREEKAAKQVAMSRG